MEYVNILLFLVKIIFIAMIVFGNLLVLIVMIKRLRRRKSTRNYFIISIAVCDLIIGAVSSPFCFVSIFNFYLSNLDCDKIILVFSSLA